MATSRSLKLFISSKMTELKEERCAVGAALEAYRMEVWQWEKDAGSRSEPVYSTYLSEVTDCDIYIGLFWLGYGQYTIEEFDWAYNKAKPCLIYIKETNIEQRDQPLQQFLDRIKQVKNSDGLTSYPFQTIEELTR
jgi:hypothetical protein